MECVIAAMTDIGLTKSTNQDSYNARIISTKQGKMVFAVLCDGMGGLSKGEVASGTMVNAFCKWTDTRLPRLCEGEISDEDIRADWLNIVNIYNERLKNYGKVYNINIGTTLTAMLITEKRYYIINVGDTRAYEMAEELRILTKDQTVVNQELELGHITHAEAEKDARRSVLLQCIGASEVVNPDMFYGNTKKDAVYMLCSDGFRHEVSSNEIWDCLNPQKNYNSENLRTGMASLINLNKQRNEKDNITVVGIKIF